MEGVEKYVCISKFYAGKSVFVTGGSGFLGKVLIEKLLYSCPLVDNIYVLLRDKKSVRAEQRLENLIDQPVFSRIKAERPEALEKLVLVKGELTAVNFNMSPDDLQTVKEKVSIVIHLAATIKFNEPLKIAMAVNLEGTRNVIEFCKSLKEIDRRLCVYISTAYSNPKRCIIDEVIYPPPVSIPEAYKLIEQCTGNEDITAFLNGWPNTYTYTKALAENLVSETHGDIPTVIVRPSIVAGSLSDPTPGWIDSWSGPIWILTPIAMGVCRSLHTEYDHNIDLIPVDYVTNIVLVAATKAERSHEVSVYNSCSGTINPISMGYLIKLYADFSVNDRFNVLPFPKFMLLSKKRWLVKVIARLMYIYAYVADVVLQIIGKKPSLRQILSLSALVQEATDFVTSKSWLLKSHKAVAMAKSLSPEDYQQFPCNPQDIDWKKYTRIYYKGIKKYLIEKKM